MAAITTGSYRLLRWLGPPTGQHQRQTVNTKFYRQNLQKGNGAYEAEEYEQALAYFQNILDTRGATSKLLYKIGVCFEQVGEPDKAVATWKEATAGEAPYGPALNAMAFTLYRQGNLGKAGDHANRAIKLGLGDGTSHAIFADRSLWGGDAQTAAQYLDIAEKKGGVEHILDLVHAHFKILRKQPEDAMALLSDIPDRHPLGLLAGIYRLQLLWQQDRRAEAVEALQTAVDQHPGRPWAALLLAGIRFSAGQPEAARIQTRKVIDHYAHEPKIQLQLARMLRRFGEDDWALEVALNNRDEPGFRVKARLLAARIYLSRGLPRRARSVLAAAGVGRSDELPVLKVRGMVGLALNDTEMARRFFKRILKKDPRNASAHFLLARTHRKSGDMDKALKGLSKTCELEPESDWLWKEFGDALAEAGHVDRAKECYERAADLLSAHSSDTPARTHPLVLDGSGPPRIADCVFGNGGVTPGLRDLRADQDLICPQ